MKFRENLLVVKIKQESRDSRRKFLEQRKKQASWKHRREKTPEFVTNLLNPCAKRGAKESKCKSDRCRQEVSK